MKTTFKLETAEARQVLLDYLQEKFANFAGVEINIGELKVRSKQNYRNQEWETGELKIEVIVEI